MNSRREFIQTVSAADDPRFELSPFLFFLCAFFGFHNYPKCCEAEECFLFDLPSRGRCHAGKNNNNFSHSCVQHAVLSHRFPSRIPPRYSRRGYTWTSRQSITGPTTIHTPTVTREAILRVFGPW